MAGKRIWKEKPKEVFYAAGILAVSFLVGILAVNLSKNNFKSGLLTFSSDYFERILTMDLNYGGMFFYILWKHLKSFVLFWIAVLTIFGLPYIIGCLIYAGFTAGLFAAAVIVSYGPKGILLIAAYVLPQAFFYIPVYISCLKNGYQLAVTVSGMGGKISGVWKTIRSAAYRKALLFGFLFLIFGAAAEAYAGSFLLKKVLNLFVK